MNVLLLISSPSLIFAKFSREFQPQGCYAGVKLVLPALMAGVESKLWRSKQGCVQMLGAMAHLAPQPLSTALPKVVPKLSQTLSDPHPKVQAAARQALKEVLNDAPIFEKATLLHISACNGASSSRMGGRPDNAKDKGAAEHLEDDKPLRLPGTSVAISGRLQMLLRQSIVILHRN